MQVLEPIGRHALNVRATLQRLQPGVSEVHRRNHVPSAWTGAVSYSKGQPPRTMFNGARPLVALTRGRLSSTGSRERSKGQKASSLKQTRMPVREATPSCFQRTTA